METKTYGITTKDKIGYAMGDVGSLCVLGLVQSVLQKYYTDLLGISIVSVMILFIVARIWDAINDPIWGRIVDVIKPNPQGRYRVWLKRMAIPLALSSILMFIKIPGLTSGQYFAYGICTYILFGMMYTCVNIPYGSLAQVITTDERERSSLSVFRSIGSTIGAFPAMVLISICYVTNADGTKSMSYNKVFIGAVIISLASIVALLLCYAWSKERVVTPPKKDGKSLKETFKLFGQLFKSRPFWVLCAVGMLFLASQMFSQSYYSYLFHYYFNKPGLTMIPTVCQYLPVAVIMLFAGKLSQKFGKKELCALGMLLAGVAFLILFFLQTKSAVVFLIFCFISGIGNAFLFLLVWALTADAIDYNAVHYDIHDDATSYSVYNFSRKLGQTVAAILINVSLMKIGYEDNVLNVGNITDATLTRMYNDSVLIPAVLFLICFVLLWFVYPLSRKKLDELQVEKEAMLAGMGSHE